MQCGRCAALPTLFVLACSPLDVVVATHPETLEDFESAIVAIESEEASTIQAIQGDGILVASHQPPVELGFVTFEQAFEDLPFDAGPLLDVAQGCSILDRAPPKRVFFTGPIESGDEIVWREGEIADLPESLRTLRIGDCAPHLTCSEWDVQPLDVQFADHPDWIVSVGEEVLIGSLKEIWAVDAAGNARMVESDGTGPVITATKTVDGTVWIGQRGGRVSTARLVGATLQLVPFSTIDQDTSAVSGLAAPTSSTGAGLVAATSDGGLHRFDGSDWVALTDGLAPREGTWRGGMARRPNGDLIVSWGFETRVLLVSAEGSVRDVTGRLFETGSAIAQVPSVGVVLGTRPGGSLFHRVGDEWIRQEMALGNEARTILPQSDGYLVAGGQGLVMQHIAGAGFCPPFGVTQDRIFVGEIIGDGAVFAAQFGDPAAVILRRAD